jgi:phosphatidate cytidylyltransferase
VTRVWSGAVLVALALAVVWFAPPIVFFAVAEGLLFLAFVEYAELVRASGLLISTVVPAVAAGLTCAAFAGTVFGGFRFVPLDVVLMSAFVTIGAMALQAWRGGRDAIAMIAAELFPSLYLGLPLGAMVAIRESRGPDALFLLMLTVMVSDTAQYYTGRAFGRYPLAPAISPKKTVEGAIGGFLCGALLIAIVGQWWLPGTTGPFRLLLGLAVVALGIVGDLFESMLKRSAKVKDSSALIPGHGGVLDRIDALLFAAPVYYIVLKYVS